MPPSPPGTARCALWAAAAAEDRVSSLLLPLPTRLSLASVRPSSSHRRGEVCLPPSHCFWLMKCSGLRATFPVGLPSQLPVGQSQRPHDHPQVASIKLERAG